MTITELQHHDTNIVWSGQPFDTSTAIPVPDFERPAPEHDKPNATSIDTPLSSSPTEWNSHELARLHREEHPDAAYLNAAYYDVFDGQTPDGSGPAEYVAYKPLPPDVYAIKAARDAAYNDLDSGQKAMAGGSLISALYLGVPDTAERLTRGIKNLTLRTIARRSIEFLGYGSLIGGAAGCLGRSVAPPVAPTLPPPGGETSIPSGPHPTELLTATPVTVEAPATAVAYGDGIDPANIREAPGVFPGIGGEGEQYLMPMTDALRNNLNAQHYAPVYESGGTAAIVTGYDANGDGVNDVTTCTTATRDQMFSNVDRTQVLLLDYVDSGVAYYVNSNTGEVENKVVTTITLPPLADGRDTMCVQAIVNDPTSPEYTLLYTLVIDESGTVLARLPVFSGNDDVRVEWTDAGTQVKVNDVDYPMEVLAGVVFATSTPPPTFTPEPSATPEPLNESLVYGCKDETKIQQVLNDFRTDHPGFDFNSISVSKVDFVISGGEWITVNHDGTLIGEYTMDLSGKDVAGFRAGANSYARCMVVMIPGINDPISIIDRLFVDGQQMNVLLLDRRLVDNTKVDNFINSNIGKVIRFDIVVADKYAQKPATQPPYESINLDWYNNLFTQLGSIGSINDPVDEKLVKNLGEFYNNSGGLVTRNLTIAK